MAKQSKYSLSQTSIGSQRIELSDNYADTNVQNINEQSTPIEMANFVARKIVEVIQHDLQSKANCSSQINNSANSSC